jgi:hypothetical protein
MANCFRGQSRILRPSPSVAWETVIIASQHPPAKERIYWQSKKPTTRHGHPAITAPCWPTIDGWGETNAAGPVAT